MADWGRWADQGLKYGAKVVNDGVKEVANLQPSPETLDTLKRDAIAVSETLTKLADDTWSKGSEAASTILALPTSQAVVANTASALHKLEGEARNTICAIANDPRTQDVAVHLQKLDQDASAALEQALAHPTAIAARGQVELLSKGASETYEDFLKANPAARDFAKAAEQAGRGCVGMCQEHPVLCGMLAAGLVEVVLPGTIPGLIGFGRLGPGKGTIAAEVQRSVYGGAVAKGSAFAGMQSWGMAGMQGLAAIGVAGAGVALVGSQKLPRGDDYQQVEKYVEGGAVPSDKGDADCQGEVK